MAVILSLLISMVIGKSLINVLKSFQVSETVRKLGLNGESEKEGTPTMGGLIILAAIILPTILFAKLHNIYIILIIFSTIWLGMIGFIDDYIKVFRKNKKGLAGSIKVLGQVILGLIVGGTLFFHPDVVVREKIKGKNMTAYDYSRLLSYNKVNQSRLLASNAVESNQTIGSDNYFNNTIVTDVAFDPLEYFSPQLNSDFDKKSTKTTIPFFKLNEFDYSKLLSFLGESAKSWTFLIYIPIVIFIISAVSNGANLTDGLDGLATGVSAIIVGTLGIFAYVSGNIIFSNYLNIMYIPNIGELVIFIGAVVGACIGFLWYNSYPAQVFMGDTGSLTLGGIIAVLAIMVRKELLIPILCGIFLMENLSVVMQVTYFKYTKKKFGVGKRIFKMSPLHHHYQLLGMNESKIVTRFWIVGLMLAVLTVLTLKLR